jgi:hypothetical protein
VRLRETRSVLRVVARLVHHFYGFAHGCDLARPLVCYWPALHHHPLHAVRVRVPYRALDPCLAESYRRLSSAESAAHLSQSPPPVRYAHWCSGGFEHAPLLQGDQRFCH